jgi:hypothetical protein
MKFCTAALLIASWSVSVSGFSAVAPGSVDRSLKGIDSDDSVFDPTTGQSPALQRNNNDEVWVSQVCERGASK